jgi:hypothetical protein
MKNSRTPPCHTARKNLKLHPFQEWKRFAHLEMCRRLNVRKAVVIATNTQASGTLTDSPCVMTTRVCMNQA